MMRKDHWRKVFFAVPALALVSSATAGATEVWTSPTYTEQWSSPTYTEQWSVEPEEKAPTPAPAKEAAPAPAAAPKSSDDSIYIRLKLDSKQAVIQNENVTLDAPPTAVNGRTMVPFRFLGEALRATVDWDAAKEQITLSLRDNTVVLKMNQSSALVNGRTVPMDAPPVISGGRTLVPLRFIAENLDLSVTHTASTNTIEIGNSPTGGGSAGNEPSAPAAHVQEPITDFEQLYGTWHLWTPGGATNLYYTDTGNYATHIYDAGAEQGTVTINADGTFAMQHALWGDAEGEWRLSFPAEINGERILAIVLQQGSGDYDWAVAPGQNGKIRLLSSWGAWADGSSSWLFESELYKK
ncbi:copper amine oxidase N-terminal domain-containing protein [Paenibacillus antri]|nr:copper amine oxidase N-terminal domain-containing protein [Paenibacillus antri]